jgi:hypothetical protein
MRFGNTDGPPRAGILHSFVGTIHTSDAVLLSYDTFRGCEFTGTRSPASHDHTIRSGELTRSLACLVIGRKFIFRVVQGL